MASKKSSRKNLQTEIFESVYGHLDNSVRKRDLNPGFEICSLRRPLSSKHGRKIHWGLAVIQIYLKNIREGKNIPFPEEATFRPPRFEVLGGRFANRRRKISTEGGLP